MGSGVGGDGAVGRGSWLVGWGRGGVVAGLTLIPHVSNVAGVGIGGVVGHDLGTAVREEHAVLAVGGIVVASLVLGEVNSSVVILDSVLVLVLGRNISGLRVSRPGFVSGSRLVGVGPVSQGHGGKSESNEDLQEEPFVRLQAETKS